MGFLYYKNPYFVSIENFLRTVPTNGKYFFPDNVWDK